MPRHSITVTPEHADGTVCPPEHKHTTGGTPLTEGCTGRYRFIGTCSGCTWRSEPSSTKSYAVEQGRRHRTTNAEPKTTKPSRGPAVLDELRLGHRQLSRVPAPRPLRPLLALEAPMPNHITVGQFMHQLQTMDPDLPLLLAINPDWPHSHHVGRVVEGHGPNGPALYVAENGQEGVLPPEVRQDLDWAAV